MVNSEVCILYDCKNWTNWKSCMILAVCYAFLLSVSFKPIFVDSTLVIDMLFLLQFSMPYAMVEALFFDTVKHYEFFRVFLLDTMNFSECLVLQKFPFLFFVLYYFHFFRLKKKTNWRSCTELLNFQVFFLSRPQLWFISFSTFRQIKRHNRVCRTLSCTGWSGHTLELDKSKSIP